MVWWRVCMYMWRCVYMLWCGVVLWCCFVWCGVVRLGMRKNPSVCRFKTPPCVRSRRLRVYPGNARACSTHARVFRVHTEACLNLHTEGFSAFSSLVFSVLLALSLSLLSLFPSLSLFRRSLSLSLLSSLSSLLSSLSATMTMITRPVGSLCVHTALTYLSVRVRGLRSIPCLAIMFASCKKQLSWHNCANLVPLGMKWAYVSVLEMGYAFVCVSMCQYVLSSLCCWLRQCWRLCVGCCAVVKFQKRPKRHL